MRRPHEGPEGPERSEGARNDADIPDVLLERTPIHEGRVVRLSLDRVRFPDGEEGELEFIRHRGAAAVIPFLDPPTDPDPRIILLRQYRYAAGGVIYEIPAGIIDDADADWEACAHRELAEETGFRASEIRYLSRIFTTPGFTNEVIHIFAAAGLEGGTVDRDHDEYLEVVEMPFSRAIEGVRRGEVVDGKTVAALLYAQSFLPSAWGEARPAPPRTPGR